MGRAATAQGASNHDGATLRAGLGRRRGWSITGPRYEVMYFLEAPDDTLGLQSVWQVSATRSSLSRDGLWTATSTPTTSGAVEAALDVGRPRIFESRTSSTRSRRNRGCVARSSSTPALNRASKSLHR